MDYNTIPHILKLASVENPRMRNLKVMSELLEISYKSLEHPIFKYWNGYEAIEPFKDALESPEYFKIFNKTLIERTINQSLFYSEIESEDGIVTMQSEGIEYTMLDLDTFLTVANKLYAGDMKELNELGTNPLIFRLQYSGRLSASVKYLVTICNEMILRTLIHFIQSQLNKIEKEEDKVKFLLKQKIIIKQREDQFEDKVFKGVINTIQLNLDYHKELNQIITTFSNADNLKEDKILAANSDFMSKNFEIKRAEAFDKPYLKVYLKAGLDHVNIAAHIETLDSVRKANVTDQQSGKRDLTIYPALAYDISEVEQEVALTLKNYFEGSSVDPSFITETISSIGDKAYFQILDYILLLGKNLEKLKKLNTKFDEESYRDYFLPFLNSISKHHSSKGEVFNKQGKTDIILFDQDGNNLFIAECKLWKGEAYLLEGVQQMLENYVNWRDEKTAIIIFNHDNKKFSNVIEVATKALSNHPLCIKTIGVRKDTSYSYLFRHINDSSKTIKLELVLLDFAS